jgi:hypothetical protein
MRFNAKALLFTSAVLSIFLTAVVVINIRTSRSDAVQMRSPSSTSTVKDGTGNGGGGGSYVVVDGQLLLSDAFYDDVGEDHSYNELPKPLRQYLDRAELLLKKYGINGSNFWDGFVRGTDVVYTFLSKDEFDRVPCNKYLPPINQGADKHVQMGCTIGNTTYLIASEFKAANLLEQAKTIIHERLWALNSTPNQQRYIARFTTVLGQLLKKQDDQLFRNDRTPLSQNELMSFDRLELAARQFGFEVGVNRTIYIAPNGRFKLTSPLSAHIVQGGGVKSSDELVDDKSFIGIGTILYGNQTVIKNSTLIDADVWSAEISDATLIASEAIGVRIHNSTIDHSRVLGLGYDWFDTLTEVADHTLVLNFSETAIPFRHMKAAAIQYATISNSQVDYTRIAGTSQKPVVIRDSLLQPSDVLSTIAAGAQIESSLFKGRATYEFKIGADAEIKNVHYRPAGQLSVEFVAGVKVKNLKLKPLFEGGLFRKIWATIHFEGDSMDFGNKSCEFTTHELQIKKTKDLLKLCN